MLRLQLRFLGVLAAGILSPASAKKSCFDYINLVLVLINVDNELVDEPCDSL